MVRRESRGADGCLCWTAHAVRSLWFAQNLGLLGCPRRLAALLAELTLKPSEASQTAETSKVHSLIDIGLPPEISDVSVFSSMLPGMLQQKGGSRCLHI